MWLLALPMAAGMVLVMLLSALIGLAIYQLVWRIWPGGPEGETWQAANLAGTRIGTLNALILSLAFSAVRAEYNELGETIDNEALALEQLYRGLETVESDEAAEIRTMIAGYTRMVIDEEWPAMQRGQPLAAADRLVDEIRMQLIGLSGGESGLNVPAVLLSDIKAVENARGQRSFDISESVGGLFWAIASLSFAGTMACFFAFRPGRGTLAIVALFSAVGGSVFYGIVAFSYPFQNAALMKPDALEAVYERTMQHGG